MQRSLLVLALAASPALAFVGTSPLVAWSTSSLSIASGPVVNAANALSTVLGGTDVCGSKVLVISQEDLHSEDLPDLPLLSSFLPSATLQIPYLTSPSLSTLDAALASVASACGSSVDVREAGENLAGLWKQDGFGAVKVVAGREAVEGENREDQLRWEDSLIAPQVKDLLDAAVPHVIILTGHSSPATLLAIQRRQLAERPLASPFKTGAASLAAAPSSPAANSTLPASSDLPLLERYQLLSTPVLTMTLVSLLVLLPILGMGIAALASIQVPPRMDNVKGVQVGVTLDKKNQ